MALYMTSGIQSKIEKSEAFAGEVSDYICRYSKGDWGDLCQEDKQMNVNAIKHGGRIFAAYKSSEGKIFIITDDTKTKETVTTVLFAEEY